MPTALITPPGRAPSSLFTQADLATQRAFFSARPDLAPTPLRSLPALARDLRIAHLVVKDETSRYGLDAFKSVGVVFAVSTLRARGAIRRGDTLTCASEGNHGRAVARAARQEGCSAQIYMAENAAAARVSAIQSEGARVVAVTGTYDDAVREMARDAAARGWTIVSDTSWPGYDEIPRLIMLGYTRLFDEAEASWQPGARPDVMFVPAGVGGVLAAAASWADTRYGLDRPLIVGVEPASAACVQVSVQHDRPTTLAGPFETMMAGLRCGEMSPVAFDAVRSLVDVHLAIEDDWSFAAMRRLAMPQSGDPAIRAGASGAAALGGLLALRGDAGLTEAAHRLGLGPSTSALVLVTEGATEPALFQNVLSHH